MILAFGIAAPPVGAQTQSAMNAAAARAARAADQTLNAQYRMTMGGMSASRRVLLRDAQRSWILFRDRQCRFEASAVEGGSAYPMVQAGCVRRLTEDRTRQLGAQVRWPEGDLACPQDTSAASRRPISSRATSG
jgi:uncharacterized protein YecT (DUF1311 family)